MKENNFSAIDVNQQNIRSVEKELENVENGFDEKIEIFFYKVMGNFAELKKRLPGLKDVSEEEFKIAHNNFIANGLSIVTTAFNTAGLWFSFELLHLADKANFNLSNMFKGGNDATLLIEEIILSFILAYSFNDQVNKKRDKRFPK